MRPLLAFVSFLLLLHATRSDASAADSNPIIECQLCINTLAMLANYSLEDPKIVDWLMAHAFDAASAAGICAKDGGPSGVLTPDVCLGAIGEYGPLIASIVAAHPPLVRETVQFVCEALKLCPIASLSEVGSARERGATCKSSPPHARYAAPPRSKSARDVEQGSTDVGTFVVITDVHWDPDYSPGMLLTPCSSLALQLLQNHLFVPYRPPASRACADTFVQAPSLSAIIPCAAGQILARNAA
jgi:hypothetical protein